MSTLKVNEIIDSNGDNTTTVNGIPLRPGVLDPENRIINGAFDFWQRGTSQTGSGYQSADRWRQSVTGGTVTMSRQSFSVGDTLGANSPTFFLRQTVSGQTLASHFGNFRQNIEGVRSYAGQTITLLGWARRSSGSGNMAVDVIQNFGTGGSPSSLVEGIGPATITLSSGWSAFAVTIAVPSIAGKTLGTNGDDYLSVRFWTSAGSDFNALTNSLGLQTIGVDLWGIHIKVGTHTTAAVDLYRQPELGPELARCQRYYERTSTSDIHWNGQTTSGSTYYTTVNFKVSKRALPSIFRGDNNANMGGNTITQTTENFRLTAVATVTAASSFIATSFWAADAELF